MVVGLPAIAGIAVLSDRASGPPGPVSYARYGAPSVDNRPSAMTGERFGADMLEAIWDDRLAEIDDDQARDTCAAIGATTGDEVERAVSHLDRCGVAAEPVGDPDRPSQRRSAAISVDSAADGLSAARHLGELGYRAWDPIDGPAEAIHRRFRHNLTLARTTDATMVLDVRWPEPSGISGLLPAALVPNQNDYDLVGLTSWLWPLYLALRPLRLLAKRLGLARRSRRRLGPFLGTPQSLIGPLLDLANATADDVLIDLGCGDGRVVLEAASTVGCQAIGVESNPALADEARRRVDQAGAVGQLVTIVQGDATQIERYAADATLFFVFVPAEAGVELISRLSQIARPGSRIVAHEQHRLLNEPQGAVATPVLVDDAVTVGHCWTVS